MDQVPESRQPGGRNAIAYTDSPMYLGAGSRGGLLRRCCRTSHAHRFLLCRYALGTCNLLHQGHTHEKLATQVCVSLTLLHNSGTSVPPPLHTYTHTQKRSLYFSMLDSFPGLNSFLLLGEKLGTRLTLASYPGAWVRV